MTPFWRRILFAVAHRTGQSLRGIGRRRQTSSGRSFVLEECHDAAHLKSKILGPKGHKSHFIQDKSGARVWLRESPMQLEICASTEPALELAVNMARDLANTVAAEPWWRAAVDGGRASTDPGGRRVRPATTPQL